MWILVSKIQKSKIENQMRKKYLDSFTEIISQIRRRQHKVKNQFATAFGMYRLYDTYDELVAKQKEFLGRVWEYELPTDAIVLEEPAVVALLYEKINEAIEKGIQVQTIFSCSMRHKSISDIIWVQILGIMQLRHRRILRVIKRCGLKSRSQKIYPEKSLCILRMPAKRKANMNWSTCLNLDIVQREKGEESGFMM